MKVHPAADLFPLAEAELQALADDIARNGQRVPILAIKNGGGELELVDGRRRMRACEIAGVEPAVETLPADTDVVALVVSLNVHRRNLTAGQRAIAAAEAWLWIIAKGDEALASDDVRDSIAVAQEFAGIKFARFEGHEARDTIAGLFGSNRVYVQQARALVERDPDAAAAVKGGTTSLTEAYDELRDRERNRESRAARLDRLRATYADLGELVDAGKLGLDEALAAGRERDDQARQLRQVTTKALADLCILGASAPDRAAHDADNYDPSYDATHAVTPAALRSTAAYCAAIADELEGRPR